MFTPENELGVIVVFAKESHHHGFEIRSIGAAFPDALIEKDGLVYRAEFEFMASAFDTHDHDHRECDLIICWENDNGKCVLPVLALSEVEWMHTSLELPTDAQRAAYYWERRALKAERALQLAKTKTEKAMTPTSFFCEVCNTYWPSQKALAGHGNAHRPKEVVT